MVCRVALALACVSAMLIPESASPTPLLKGPGVIRITSKQISYKSVDFGASGLSPGDIEVTRESLYNTRIRAQPIGHSELVCVYVGAHFRNCNGTYILPAGKLTVSGVVQYRNLYGLAVTGGTDLYNNARGTLTVTLLDPSPRRSLIVFRLVI